MFRSGFGFNGWITTGICIFLAMFMGSLNHPDSAKNLNQGITDIKITVTGVAEITNNNINAAKEAAKKNALLTALEETLGYYIIARSESENYESIYNRIIAQTAGLVVIKKILKEEITGSSVKITLEAGVSPLPFFEVLRANGLLRSWRVMVIIPEIHIQRAVPDPAGETEFIRQFTAAGFKVLDPKVYTKVRHKDSEIFTSERTRNIYARKAGADILIYGEAFSETAQDASGGLTNGLVGCNARIEARAVAIDTGEIFHANGLNSRVPVLHTSELVAGKKAIQELAAPLASEFVQKLVLRLASLSRPHTIVVSGITSTEQARRFQTAVSKLKGVKKIIREHFSDNLLVFDADLKAADAEMFADRIAGLKVNGLPLRVTASTRHRTKIQVFTSE